VFYYLTQVLGDLPGGNLFNYITFRAGGATMTALLISFVLAPWMINTLARAPSARPAHSR
jgi:phospho-N-acetylmuramoyl-pentapeptide-transferase